MDHAQQYTKGLHCLFPHLALSVLITKSNQPYPNTFGKGRWLGKANASCPTMFPRAPRFAKLRAPRSFDRARDIAPGKTLSNNVPPGEIKMY